MNQSVVKLTESEIAEIFQKCSSECITIEETSTCSDDEVVRIIQNLQEVQTNIINNAIFSVNESFDEIDCDNLRYLLLPYFLGFCFGKLSNNRKINLQYSERYLNEYVKLIDHYELLPKHMKKQFKSLKDLAAKYQVSREDKIANYKENKELSLKLKNIEKLDDDKSKREVVGLSIMRYLLQVLDMLPMISQELEILEYKSKIEKEGEMQQKHKEEMLKELPRMQVWNVPAPSIAKNPYLLSNGDGHHGGDGMCHSCISQTESGKRQDLIAQVWQPGSNMPTMTLDEFADGEIKVNYYEPLTQFKNMKQQEEMQKRAMEEAARVEESKDEEKDEWVDQQTMKDREWDEFKDANTKGAGNMNGR